MSQPQRLLVKRRAVLHSILFKRNGTRSLLPHSWIPSFWKQWQPSEPWWTRLWQTLENTKDFWHTEQLKFYELYNPTEHLAVDEVIMLYKGRGAFRQYIPKKHQNLQTLRRCGLHLRYERVFRQTKATCHSSNNSNSRNGASSYSKSWGTVPQSFHGQLFLLACSVWWSIPTKNQCVWNSSPSPHDILDQNL